jgi:hypothetical protein
METSQKGTATSSRASKLAKLTKLRKNIPQTSKSALEAILQNIKDDGLPELTTAKNMREGCRVAMEQMNGYGPLLLEHRLHGVDGSIKKVKLVNLLSYIHAAYKAGGGFHTLLKKTLAKHNSPLSLLVYADEVTPGNVLANVPTRKMWCIYISIKEFSVHLQKEAAWMTVGLIRSDTVAALDGHLSQVLSALLESIFYSSYGMCKNWVCNCRSHEGMQHLAKDSSCSWVFLLWMVKLPNFLGAPKETVAAAFVSNVPTFSNLLMTMTMMQKMAPCQRLQSTANLTNCIWFLTRKFSRAGTG